MVITNALLLIYEIRVNISFDTNPRWNFLKKKKSIIVRIKNHRGIFIYLMNWITTQSNAFISTKMKKTIYVLISTILYWRFHNKSLITSHLSPIHFHCSKNIVGENNGRLARNVSIYGTCGASRVYKDREMSLLIPATSWKLRTGICWLNRYMN